MGDSQEQNEVQSQKQETCLKCGNPISHVPYRYEGHTFHARCLLCSHCGKRLVGKPFITEGKSIFCGDHCKDNYEEMPTPDLNTSRESQGDEKEALSESLVEALESIKEPKQGVLRLSRQGSPLRVPDTDRVTDYPISSSPDSIRSRSPAPGSRRSSLSAVSECSITSDNSMSFNASKRPGRNILKKPHGPRRRSRNRVRWNLPNGDIDSDTTSLESFDSSTTGSIIYQRARNGVAESRHNWREFERSPSPGSTGLTPARLPPSRNQHRFLRASARPSSPYQEFPTHPTHNAPRITVEEVTDEMLSRYSRSPSPHLHSPLVGSPRQSPSPELRPTSPRLSPSPEPRPTSPRLSPSPEPRPTSPRLSPSPEPRPTSPSLSQSSEFRPTFPRVLMSPTQRMHSTPLRRYHSDASASLRMFYKPRLDPRMDYSRNESSETVLNVSVLKIDSSNLSELDATSYDDRQKRQLFEFPQEDRRMRKFSAPSGYTTYTLPGNPFRFVDDDDDYDHLSPLNPKHNLPEPKFESTPVSEGSQTSESIDKSSQRLSGIYRDHDIDEALEEISQEVKASNQYPSSQGSRQHDENPPPLPPKQVQPPTLSRGGLNVPKKPMATSQQFSPPPPIPAKNEELLKQLADTEIPTSSTRKETSISPPPPPLPRRSYSMNRDGISQNEILSHYLVGGRQNSKGKYKPLPPLPPLPEASPEIQRHPPKAQRGPLSRSAESRVTQPKLQSPILSPPPEFAATLANPSSGDDNDRNVSKGRTTPPSSSEDGLGSVSNTTLVADQEESPDPISVHPASPPIHSKHSWSSAYPMKGESERGKQAENAMLERRTLYIPASSPDTSSDEHNTHVMHTRIQNSQPQVHPVFTVPSSIRYPSKTAEERVQPQAVGLKNAYLTATSPTVRHKNSLEQAYTVGNLLRDATHIPPQQSRQRKTSEDITNQRQPTEPKISHKLRRSTSSSYRPLPPKNIGEHFSPEDQHILNMFYSGGKLPTMKPVFHDAEKSIEEMLAELESDSSGDERQSKKHPCGPCDACGKIITSTRHLVSHDSSRYHIKCYCCSACGCSLKGKKVYRLRNTLLCKNDYQYGVSAVQPVALRQPGRSLAHQANSPTLVEPAPRETLAFMAQRGGRVTSV